jgi:hypothetical protein
MRAHLAHVGRFGAGCVVLALVVLVWCSRERAPKLPVHKPTS